jgi:Tfp pilus assembly protein PilO
MTGYLDKLNLRPFEKRLVVAVGVILFVVINAWFIFPHFADLNQTQVRKAELLKKLQSWQAECDQIPKYRAAVASLVGEGAEVPLEDQQHNFSTTIQMQQSQSGVNVTSTGRTSPRTNDFFIELTQTIGVQSPEPQLVDFLFKLGEGTSLIRVRGLTLRTDPPRQQLVANVTLVASYQKNPPKKPAAAAPTTAAKPGPAATKRP